MPADIRLGNSRQMFPNPRAPKLLLTDTSGFPGPARLASGLAKLGCRISVACPAKDDPLAKVRSVRQVYGYSSLRPMNSLLAAIEKCQPHFIIPCDDNAVQHLHELYACARRAGPSAAPLSSLIECSLGAPESYHIVSSRYAFLATAREEGLPIPATHGLDCVGAQSAAADAPAWQQALNELQHWTITQTFPIVLKADGTWGGSGVRIAHDPHQIQQSFFELIRRPGFIAAAKRLLLNRDRFWLGSWWTRARPDIIAQQYIDGRPANCAVFCWKGAVLAGIAAEVVSTRHANGPATVVRLVDSPEMMQTAERMVHRLRLSGFFGFDFVIDAHSQTPYLIEMNPRCTQLCHLQLGKNRDLMAALYAQLSGEQLHERLPVTHNDLAAYFPEAWTCHSEFLHSSFHDIPFDEPELIAALLRPSRDRTFLGRALDSIRRELAKARASHNSGFHPQPAASRSTPRMLGRKVEG